MMTLERERVPAFKSAYQFPEPTAAEIKPGREFIDKGRHSLIAPIWAINTRYKAAKPIKVHIYSEDNLFFAENETLVVIGTGASQKEATEDFCKHIVYFYNYYKSLSWDNVTGDARRLKSLYETLLEG